MPYTMKDLEAGHIDLSDVVSPRGGTIPLEHPGVTLKKEVMEPLGLSAYRLAKCIGVPLNRVTAILAGKRAITAETSIRLGRFLSISPEFWHRMQADYDLRRAQEKMGELVIDAIEPLENAD